MWDLFLCFRIFDYVDNLSPEKREEILLIVSSKDFLTALHDFYMSREFEVSFFSMILDAFEGNDQFMESISSQLLLLYPRKKLRGHERDGSGTYAASYAKSPWSERALHFLKTGEHNDDIDVLVEKVLEEKNPWEVQDLVKILTNYSKNFTRVIRTTEKYYARVFPGKRPIFLAAVSQIMKISYLQKKYGRRWRDLWIQRSMDPQKDGLLFKKWKEQISNLGYVK